MLLIDQLDREITVRTPINTVISLVPSHTELLMDLGLKSVLKGRTKFCIHPKEDMSELQIVGGTKTIDFDKIDSINPDLIICNKEENNKKDVLHLAERYPVWVSDIKTFEDSCLMINDMAKVFNLHSAAAGIIDKSKEKLITFRQSAPLRAAYLIWRKPYMTVGSDTYIHDMMGLLGYENVFSHMQRYPIITVEDFRSVNPDTILLSSEPYPFTEKHKEKLEQMLPQTKIQLVDGELFSWYGSRIIHKNRI